MKKLTSLALGLIFIFSGCSRNPTAATDSAEIQFTEAGVKAEIAGVLTKIDQVPEGMVAPTVVGKFGLVQAYWSNASTLDALTQQMEKVATGDPTTVAGSVSQRPLDPGKGVQGRVFKVAKTSAKSPQPMLSTSVIILTKSERILILDVIGSDSPEYAVTVDSLVQSVALN